MEISLPGQQVHPLPKLANKNRKNNQKNKPNGFICFANSQKKLLTPKYDIRGPQMLVELCDPLWRKLTPDEKKMWTQKAKEEHARSMGKKSGDPALRMDCNRKFISERQDAERAEVQRKEREKKFVKAELERCEEVIDKEFFIIDALSTVEYMDGENVPCEIAVVKCTVRSGIIGYYHFFPDPGPLRAGHFAEALERCELEHEIKPKDFPLASKDYEGDVSQLVQLMNLHSPKHPLIFARSSEAKKAESCLEWLGFRVDQEFKPRVMELESFIEELVTFTKNTPPSFSQIRRLLFETKFDFIQGNRCDYHSQTDKIACSIGNVRKYLYFMCEILYDYFEFDIIEGHHFPVGFDNSCAGSRSSFSMTSSVLGDQDFDDVSSVASSFSVGSYHQGRNVEPPRRPNSDFSFSSNKKKSESDHTPELLSQVSNLSLESQQPNSYGSVNSFNTAPCPVTPSSVGWDHAPGNSFIASSSATNTENSFYTANNNSFTPGAISISEPPRRPNSSAKDLTYNKSCGVHMDQGNHTYVSGVNSFRGSSMRSLSPSPSLGRGSTSQQSNQSPLSQPYESTSSQPHCIPINQPSVSLAELRGSRTDSTTPSIGRSRARQVLTPSVGSAPSIGRGRGRGGSGKGGGSVPSAAAPLPRRPNVEQGKKGLEK